MSILLSILLNTVPVNLPPHVYERLALVPVEDLPIIKLDSQGGIFYRDEGTLIGDEFVYNFTGDPYTLHSNPTASKKLFLNFGGYDFVGTPVAEYDLNLPTIAPPANLSPNEVHAIWHHVAEDYSPFDVDVTTEQPSGVHGEIVFTTEKDSNGDCLVECGWGGVAWLYSWGEFPGLVYVNNVRGTVNKAEAGAHEAGHLLGLHHDGTKGKRKLEYFRGYGNWAPTMGNSYNSEVSQWNNGDYRYANNFEDDVQIIRDQLGTSGDAGIINDMFDVDIFQHTFTTPTKMTVAPTGMDGYNLNVELYYNDVIYNLDDLESYIIFSPGTHQFGISGGGDTYYSEYGSLGRYVITFENYTGVAPIITVCGNTATADSSGYWYVNGELVGTGTSVTLNSGDYNLLFNNTLGQTVTPVSISNGKKVKGC